MEVIDIALYFFVSNSRVFLFIKIPNVRKYFGVFGVFYIINRYFEYRIRILCIFLYMGT